MHDFRLTKRCSCPRRLWTKGCHHGWHYRFKWHGHDYRDSVDTVLGRHVDSKTEAMHEVEKIFDSVREGRFGIKPTAPLTLRQVGEVYFQKIRVAEDRQAARPERTGSVESDDG